MFNFKPPYDLFEGIGGPLNPDEAGATNPPTGRPALATIEAVGVAAIAMLQ